MKKGNAKRLFLSWGLLISLMIPMLLDGLHYIIFHHHDEASHEGMQFNHHETSHNLCSYPFVTEEFTKELISITPFERIIGSFYNAEIHLIVLKPYFSNPLRGPPSKTC
ncbi:MAG: hypothetical protein KAG64_08850 [Bacteroidales bacterium]|nr:hypothetical protein [Bacteroidales bacterium]